MFDVFKKPTNVDRGNEAEDAAKSYLSWRHQKIRRTGRGSDYEGIDVDPFTGKVTKTPYEVKRNDSRLSKKQRRTRGLKVIRVRDDFLGNPTNISEERKDGSRIGNRYDDILGFGHNKKPSRKKTRNEWGFF
ncbi:MAG: hypothetical protein KGI10_07515 [Thaumarchaeota archaeon]|nr:hypothetical protein [Nitrososphaerota archaeon]